MTRAYWSVLLLLCVSTCSALVVHTSNSSRELASVFTTISSSPSGAFSANVTFVRNEDMDGCNFKNSSFAQKVHGTIVVYADYLFKAYLFKKCVTDEFGNAVLFQKVAQEAGAVGVVTQISDYEINYQDGRIAGFTTFTKIPFLTVHKTELEYLISIEHNITEIEIPEISAHDNDTIRFINEVFRGMIIADAILFFLAFVLFGQMLIRDLKTYINEVPRKKPAGISVKVTVFISCIFAILYLLVDPGSFRLRSHFPSVFFMYMHIGTCFIVLYLILGIWARVTIKVKPDRFVWVAPYFIYILSGLMLVFTILISSLFYIIDVSGWYLPFRIYGIASVVICEIGYVYYGRNIVSVLCGSGNAAPAHHRLSVRIVAFILFYLVWANIAVFVFQTGTLGGILGVLFFEFFIGLCFNSICLILLFHSKSPNKKGPSQDVMLETTPNNSA